MRLSLFFLLLLLFACRQSTPQSRPALQTPELDQRITQILSFSVPLISTDSFTQIQDQCLLLDARSADEFNTSHLPNAQRLTSPSLNTPLLQTLDRDNPIVIYCTVGYRSEKLGVKLQQLGFTKVFNLYGSIIEWANQGRPLVDQNGQDTRKVHVHSKRWSKWLIEGQAEGVW